MRKVSYIDDFEHWKSEFEFYIDIRVRLSETDMLGHMNNTSPFIYFEEARTEFIKQLSAFNFHTESTTVPIVADLQCDFHSQVFFDEQLKLYIKVQRVGTSSSDIHYMALKEKKVCFTGRGRLVNVDMKNGRPIPFTKEQEKDLLEGVY